tara:strand:- start:1900 stop:2268 length:369 start_codon:yes stop_codon:yes gene_type:complete
MFGSIFRKIASAVGKRLGQKALGSGARLGLKTLKNKLVRVGTKHVADNKDKLIKVVSDKIKDRAGEEGQKLLNKGIEKVKDKINNAQKIGEKVAVRSDAREVPNAFNQQVQRQTRAIGDGGF